ncbi:MAG: hypothetical protein HY020_11120 [Burkholderiales bacterium]|nr:hypothetical protein [Burkholderiales bacterium]
MSAAAFAPPWFPPLEQVAPARGFAPRPAQRAADVAALRAAVDAALPHVFDPAASLRAAGLALQRALNREDAAAEHAALALALAAAQSAGQLDVAVLDAACRLVRGGAVALPRASQRHQALALAAAAWSSCGRPCVLMTADDEAAAQATRSLLPLFQQLGVDAAPAGSDASGMVLRRAYAAGVVIVPARRFTADLTRDRRERNGGDALRLEARLHGEAGAGLLVTRGLFALLVDELDRVLFDDAVNPVLLSVPDDSTALGAALQRARELTDLLDPVHHYTLSTEQGLGWTAAGAALAGDLITTLPPLWRQPERAEWLLRQALVVRDLLQPGRHYTLTNAQVHLDDAIGRALPDRGLLPQLTQAIQARAGVPLNPITRATERASVLGLAGSAHRLAGAAADLHGMAAVLWRQHGLVADTADASSQPRVVRETCRGDADWQARVQAAFGAPPDVHRLFVLRQLTAAARFADLPGAKNEAWVLAGIGPQRALQQLRDRAEAEGRAPASRIEILFTEPLDSRRAEGQFIARVLDAAEDAEVGVRLLLHADARWVQQALGPLARPLRALCQHWLAAAPRLLNVTLALLRWQLARQQARALQAQAQREHQLKLQLSFAGTAQVLPQTPSDPARRTS